MTPEIENQREEFKRLIKQEKGILSDWEIVKKTVSKDSLIHTTINQRINTSENNIKYWERQLEKPEPQKIKITAYFMIDGPYIPEELLGDIQYEFSGATFYGENDDDINMESTDHDNWKIEKV